MNKVLKFMSLLLIVPVLGVGSLLTGCKKEEADINDIRNTYNAMILKYQTEDVNNTTKKATSNKLFSYSKDVTKDEAGNYNFFSTSSAYDVDFRIQLENIEVYVTTDGNGDQILVGGPAKDSTGDLLERYKQLITVYGELLGYSNQYFKKYQQSFFEESSADSIDKKALYNLLGKLKNLENQVENFSAHLNDRKSLGKFLGETTEVMTTKLDTFNSVYVDLINANFEFVIEFCNVHKTYVLNAEKVDASLIVENVIAERLVYEAALKYAYAYFLDNVKSFQNNGLCKTLALNDTRYNIYAYDLQEETETLFTKVAGNWQIADNDTSKEAKQAKLESLLLQLEQAIARFDTFTNLYKVNVNKFDMYTYNQLRAGNTDTTMYGSDIEFIESLSAEGKAKLKVIETYTKYDANLLLISVNSIVNGITL